MVETPAWMKKAVPFAYYRISTEEQAKDDAGKEPSKMGTLQDQRTFVLEELKRNKLPIPKPKNEFYEVKSAKNMDRPELKKLLESMFSEASKGKRVFLAIKDPSRWTRNYILGDEVYAQLWRRNIPIISVLSGGVLRETIDEPRPNQDFMFNILTGVATVENTVKKQKSLLKAQMQRETGILPGSARTLYPFAIKDPLDVIVEERYRLPPTKKEDNGLTKAAFGRHVADNTGTYGMSPSGWQRFTQDLDAIQARLTPEEYQQWYDYRKKIQAILRERDYDPSSTAPIKTLSRKKPDFPSIALFRMAGGFLKEPYTPEYKMLDDEEIADILLNFKDYLSNKSKELLRTTIGKRKGRR